MQTVPGRRLVLLPKRGCVEGISARHPEHALHAEGARLVVAAGWPARRAALPASHFQRWSETRQAAAQELRRLRQWVEEEEALREEPLTPLPDYGLESQSDRLHSGSTEETAEWEEVEKAEDEADWVEEEEEEEWEAVWRRAHASPAWLQPQEGEAGEPPLAPLLMRFFTIRCGAGAPAEEWQLVSPRLFMAGLPRGFSEYELVKLLSESGGTGGWGPTPGGGAVPCCADLC